MEIRDGMCKMANEFDDWNCRKNTSTLLISKEGAKIRDKVWHQGPFRSAQSGDSFK